MDYHSYVLPSILFAALLVLLVLRWYKTSSQQKARSNELFPDDESDEILPGSLGEDEKELIRNIIEFQDVVVCEVMVPRIDMVAVEHTTTLKEFRLLALEKGHSRIPVYQDTTDHIIGIAYVKDMLHYWEADEEAILVTEFMRPPYFIPETKNAESLLQEFQSQKVHMAIAIDEYGGTAGIVTIEDILEEIFGEIVDEHDEEDENGIVVVNENVLEVDAKTEIDDLEDYVGQIVVEHQDFETVGGLLFSILGEIPKEQEVVEYQHLRFTILEADRHRILRVKIERMEESINVNSQEE